MSKIIESLRDDMSALFAAGAISEATMREFDAVCTVQAKIDIVTAQ